MQSIRSRTRSVWKNWEYRSGISTRQSRSTGGEAYTNWEGYIVELMYHGRWDGPLSAKDTYFEYPLLGKQIGHTPDYKISITEPKKSKENLHIGQYWDEVLENEIFNKK